MWRRLKRRWHQWRCNDAIGKYCVQPAIDARASAADSQFIVIDIETTGLDTSCAEIASLGWVEIHDGVVKLSTLRHVLVKVQQGVQQSATIHEITDNDLSEAVPLRAGMDQLLQCCQGKTLVFHNAALDYTMLNAAAKALYQVPLLMDFVDTMELEKRSFLRRKGYIAAGDLRLHSCRDRYHLPRAAAHNAALDALATAELLLAIVEYKGGISKVSLKSLIRPA